jgi:hypothetical protein
MFDDALAHLEARLDVPYPERALLLEEIAHDLETAYLAHRGRGLSDRQARAAALRDLGLDDASLRSLEAVHMPAIRRALARLPAPGRQWLEAFALAFPLAGAAILLVLEAPMIDFLREGGVTTFVVLGIGVLALLVELYRFVVWFVLRDHSVQALRKNTSTPLYLAAATGVLGLFGTALGYYVVFRKWSEGALTEEVFRVGMREPLSAVIVGAGLAALVVLVHGALQLGLRAIRIPEQPPEKE